MSSQQQPDSTPEQLESVISTEGSGTCKDLAQQSSVAGHEMKNSRGASAVIAPHVHSKIDAETLLHDHGYRVFFGGVHSIEDYRAM